jgi:Smg protein
VFDILAYLVERYFVLGSYPDAQTLSRQLAAAGFEADDIHEALDWLSGLEQDAPSRVVSEERTGANVVMPPVRHYIDIEQRRIGPEARGLLQFLESTGVLGAAQREVVIDRVMALDDTEVRVEQIKLIVLMVLWNQGQPLDTLIVDELLATERTGPLH